MPTVARARLYLRVENSVQVSFLGGRDQLFELHLPPRIFNFISSAGGNQVWNLNSGIVIWDVGILNGVLTSWPNAHQLIGILK